MEEGSAVVIGGAREMLEAVVDNFSLHANHQYLGSNSAQAQASLGGVLEQEEAGFLEVLGETESAAKQHVVKFLSPPSHAVLRAEE